MVLKKTSSLNIWLMVLVGLGFHFATLMSIFDIYFRSPLTHGMTPQPSELEGVAPAAKRVVLFVGDGLRADKLYEVIAARGADSFLRGVATQRGVWGVSHTHVPTESRPCHVAMCAGFYEDVSAVMKGWKSNPVGFDSVFNESARAWGFGSPDIIPMFSRATTHMGEFCYESTREDFKDDNAYLLDEWVFQHVEELFSAAAHTNATLAAELRTPKTSFILHLLALDTIGHGFKPTSSKYTDQIAYVDRGVERMCALIEDFYGDNATAYVFTGDHGMSDRGSHGDGEPANTRTPFLVWGAGVRGPIVATSTKNSKNSVDDTPAEWGLSGLVRHDVEQADIAPLMAALIGADFPMNSVGVLPTGVLAATDEVKARLAYQNTLQILEMYHRKEELKSEAHFYRGYPPLASLGNAKAHIAELFTKGDFSAALDASHALANVALDGLAYLQKYDWPFLMGTVVAGFLLWMLYVTLYVSMAYDPAAKTLFLLRSSGPRPLAFALALAALFAAYLVSQKSPPMYYVYAAFPCYFAWRLAANWTYIRNAFEAGSVGKTLLGLLKSLLACLAITSLVNFYLCSLSLSLLALIFL